MVVLAVASEVAVAMAMAAPLGVGAMVAWAASEAARVGGGKAAVSVGGTARGTREGYMSLLRARS